MQRGLQRSFARQRGLWLIQFKIGGFYDNRRHSSDDWKKVEVVAHEITYTGILMEVSEEEINLKGEFQWIGIPIENVVSIRPV